MFAAVPPAHHSSNSLSIGPEMGNAGVQHCGSQSSITFKSTGTSALSTCSRNEQHGNSDKPYPSKQLDKSGSANHRHHPAPTAAVKWAGASSQSEQPPAPLNLNQAEVDELYDLTEFLLRALDELNIPHILIAGSLLGAVRSQSISFNDDGVDIAIIDDTPEGGKYEILKSCLPDLLVRAAAARNDLEGGTTQCNGRRSDYTYHVRPWVASDRIQSSAAPRVWVDIFVLKKFDTRQEIKRTIGWKGNEEIPASQFDDELVLDRIVGDDLVPPSYPLYHFDNGKAIELRPRDYILPSELFPIKKELTFGHLKSVPGPAQATNVLRRHFGKDCFTHCTTSEQQKLHSKVIEKGELEVLRWETSEKLPLTDQQYLPLQHSQKGKEIASDHCRRKLVDYLESVVQISAEDNEHDDVLQENVQIRLPTERQVPVSSKGKGLSRGMSRTKSVSASLASSSLASTASHCTVSPTVSRESSPSPTQMPPPDLGDTGKWFASDVRRHIGESPETPTFDQRLRDVMEPHIAKARLRRELSRFDGDCTNDSDRLDGPNGVGVSSIPIGSSVGVPYPTLRTERPFLFDEHTYPLHQILADTIGVADLAELHHHHIQDKRLLLTPLLHPQSRLAFHECYDNFVTSFCIPLLHSVAMSKSLFDTNATDAHRGSSGIVYRYQAFPCIRVVRPGEGSVGPHCDISYGHSVGNINFHVPLTPVYGTNALYTESHPGREDWHPLTTKTLGLGHVFDGARCLHFALENTTEHTRVSLDFRIAISRGSSIPSIRGLRGGQLSPRPPALPPVYYSSSEEEDELDGVLCTERMLRDRYATGEAGYYEEVVIDRGAGMMGGRRSFFPGPVVVKTRPGGPWLRDPDKRVGFPFN